MTATRIRKKFNKWRPVFLASLRENGNVSAAARAAGVDRTTVYAYKRDNEEFAAELEDATQQAADVLESEAWRRAMDGSDLLIIFLLKGLRPEKYRERVTLSTTELDRMIEQELERKRSDGVTTAQLVQ